MSEAIVVLITCPNREEGETIARTLLEERLAACVNMAGRIYSLFHWQGAIERETEWLLIVKSRAALFERLAERVKALHSYEVPEVVAVPIVAASEQYMKWLAENTGS